MNARKILWVSVAVLAVIGGLMAGTGRPVVASGHPEWPPIMYRQDTVIVGAGPALVQKIFNDIGLKVQFPYTGSWDKVQAKAKSGAVDVLVAAYKTAEREGYMVYSEPYTTDPVALFVAKGKAFPFDNWDVLKSKKGVAMIGDSYGQEFDGFSAANLHLTRASSSQEAFDMVGSGKADYFIYSLYAGENQLKQNGQQSKFESFPKFVDEESFYITISKKSPFVKYLADVNKGIEKYKADGTINKLIDQYKNQ